MAKRMSKAKQLRESLSKGPLVIPGGFSPLVGMIAEQLGYSAVYMSGYGTSAFRLGLPDVGLISLPEMVDAAKNFARSISIPLIADADTGYGNVINVIRTLHEFEAAGVAGLQLEDQIWPKKCGHMEGKAIIPEREMVGKIRACVDAKTDEDFLIIARTDARTVEGYKEAIKRANSYADAGADIIFVESPLTEEEVREVPKVVKAPVLINMSEGAKTPLFTSQELMEFGYRIILWPSSATWAAAGAIKEVLEVLLREGTTTALEEKMVDFKRFNDLIGLKKIYEVEARYNR